MPDTQALHKALGERILILDGGFGTLLQTYDLGESMGCNDILSVTRPDIVRDIHRRYLDAGADIIETNSFNTNVISLADYGLELRAREIALAAARVARACADEYSTPEHPRFVAGSMGPTNRTLSMSADVNDPARRDISFAAMRDAYREQARGLIEGGVDLILIETVFDTLNAKAAIAAVREVSADIPVIVSATVSDVSGRTLTGQTVEAFCASVMHARPLAVGLNCGFGARSMMPYLRRLAAVAPVAVSVHPNAGLPDLDGNYDQTPGMFAADLAEICREGLVNIAGGCCGTTPAHIRALAQAVRGMEPRRVPADPGVCVLSGLEPLRIVPETNFINVGERSNVAGSAKFARLIREGAYDEALEIARAQVQAGAQIVDVCMDAPMIDAAAAMRTFLNMMSSEAEISRVPVMIDSSDFDVVETGLQCIQGKGIVNSISLKEGEEKFLDHALTVMRYGAAVVVMLFDEQGQADTCDRKIAVARRAYDLLTGIGFPPHDIIFDPNVLAVATGMPGHDRYALDFIEATRWIKSNLPGAKVSGGVSNLSFSFRGNNTVRKAMHSVFLYHAINAGMDMAIVNPQMLQLYDDIEPELLRRIEDLILYRREDASERLIALAATLDGAGPGPVEATEQWRTLSADKRILHAMLKGDTAYIADDTLEAYRTLGEAVAVINDVLMPAMARVGTLFGEGKLFLPQVVKSAKVMKTAVAAIEPYLKASVSDVSKANKVVFATVRGDVHDIGKNIVCVVLSCNGFDVTDLGVMVEPGRIVDEAVATDAAAICLSGLITPSLVEMAHVVEEAERRGLRIPIIVGGATTSEIHTAVKLAPLYSGVVIRSGDAADNASIMSRLCSDSRDEYIAEVRSRQAMLAASHDNAHNNNEADGHAAPDLHDHRSVKVSSGPCPCCVRDGYVEAAVTDLIPYINWSFFFAGWQMPGRYPEIFGHPERGAEARRLYDDAQAMLAEIVAGDQLNARGVIRSYKAEAEGDDIVLHTPGGRCALPMLRNLATGESIADYVDGSVTLFALSGAFGLDALVSRHREAGDEYGAAMAKLLADRLTEAFAEKVLPGGCRVAIGYPSAPDHTLKRDIFSLLDVERLTGMRLTGNCMIDPPESVCGFWLPSGRFVDTGRQTAGSIAAYARRRGLSASDTRLYLSPLAD